MARAIGIGNGRPGRVPTPMSTLIMLSCQRAVVMNRARWHRLPLQRLFSQPSVSQRISVIGVADMMSPGDVVCGCRFEREIFITGGAGFPDTHGSGGLARARPATEYCIKNAKTISTRLFRGELS